jgi:hypothetical protein
LVFSWHLVKPEDVEVKVQEVEMEVEVEGARA